MATQQRTAHGEVPVRGAKTETSSLARPSSQSGLGKELRRTHGWSPFSLMRRFSEDMDRMFDFFGGIEPSGRMSFWPQLEVSQQENRLVIKADVPGLRKEDLNVELCDGELCISGERKYESEQNEGGIYRSERSYGSFCRTIPLPEGAKPETAQARFENGVLQVEIEAPGLGQSRGRRIEVREGSSGTTTTGQQGGGKERTMQ